PINSLVTVASYTPDIYSHNDYYPFGQYEPARDYAYSAGGYRYSYSGNEHDDEVNGKGGSVNFGDRIEDPRIGRWLNIDPLKFKYPDVSPYIYSLDNPIAYKDHAGRDIVDANGNKVEVKIINEQGTYKVDFKFKEGTDEKTIKQFNENAKPVIE